MSRLCDLSRQHTLAISGSTDPLPMTAIKTAAVNSDVFIPYQVQAKIYIKYDKPNTGYQVNYGSYDISPRVYSIHCYTSLKFITIPISCCDIPPIYSSLMFRIRIISINLIPTRRAIPLIITYSCSTTISKHCTISSLWSYWTYSRIISGIRFHLHTSK